MENADKKLENGDKLKQNENEEKTTVQEKVHSDFHSDKIYLPTQCYKCDYLSSKLGRNVWLKMDCNLPSGSFKIRGMECLMQNAIKSGKYDSFVASSGGNAGIAASYVARHLNKPIKVFLPMTTPEKALNRLRELGADLHQEGANWNEADKLARDACEKDSRIRYVPPFSDPLLWEGHATLVHEFSKIVKPDMVICGVGGGGLFNGIRLGLRQVYGNEEGDKIGVVAVETIGCDSLNSAIKNDQKGFKLDGITSIAKSFGSVVAHDVTFDECKQTNSHSVLVTDVQAVRACQEFADNERVLVEAACGAGLAVVSDKKFFENEILAKWRENVKSDDKLSLVDPKDILVEVCGGNLIDTSMLKEYKKMKEPKKRKVEKPQKVETAPTRVSKRPRKPRVDIDFEEEEEI